MIEYRRKNSIERNDFLGILMDLQKQEKSYGIKDITAHAISLFGDGTETSGNAISFTLYELAKNWDVQEKVRQEIDSVLLKHNGKLSYEAIQEMTYLECVIYGTFFCYVKIFITYINIYFRIYASSSCYSYVTKNMYK